METIDIGNLRFVVAPGKQKTHENEFLDVVSKPKKKGKTRKRTSQTGQIFARASLHGIKNVRKVGHGCLLEQPIATNGWLVMPIGMYNGIIPREATEIVETLTKGILIKGLLIADDKRGIEQRSQSWGVSMPKISPDWGKVATVMGRVAAAIAVSGAIISILPVVLAIGAIGIAVTYDPLLIAVTADDEWICLYEWWH